jgi:hypothetical protein
MTCAEAKQVLLSEPRDRYRIAKTERQMRNALHKSPELLSRSLSGLCAASFLFFLLYTAPHRVHHFFDQVQTVIHHDSDHDHQTSDHQDKSTADSDCPFQASVNRCAIGLGTQSEPATLARFVQSPIFFHETASQAQFLPGSFQIRSPPKF